jgi:hypothetical protein
MCQMCAAVQSTYRIPSTLCHVIQLWSQQPGEVQRYLHHYASNVTHLLEVHWLCHQVRQSATGLWQDLVPLRTIRRHSWQQTRHSQCALHHRHLLQQPCRTGL